MKLKLSYSKEKGHHYIASNNIKKGEIIMKDKGLILPFKQNIINDDDFLPIVKIMIHTGHFDHLYYDLYYRSISPDVNIDNILWSKFISIIKLNMFNRNNKKIIYPKISYFNHSCLPNATLCDIKHSVTNIMALTDIYKGEEICISYLSIYVNIINRDDRNKILKIKWGFDCRCIKCKYEIISHL